jgi:hypothetical protein
MCTPQAHRCFSLFFDFAGKALMTAFAFALFWIESLVAPN